MQARDPKEFMYESMCGLVREMAWALKLPQSDAVAILERVLDKISAEKWSQEK